ncbi:MAG: hypothetical protein ABI718_14140 [Acidobacteriota bacterium]
MNDIAESYVKLVLALGQRDPGYVDAYYGPPQWKSEVERSTPELAGISRTAADLISEIASQPPSSDEMDSLRAQYLSRQLQALEARVDILQGKKMSFDEESQALYDAVAPTHPDSYFQTVLDKLDKELPGKGSLAQRYEDFRKSFIIPPDRLDAVYTAAIAECRSRTKQHIDLPQGENFRVEYVTDKPWSAYNWYQGNYQSLIQVNTELPISIDRAIDLACHEGYPGHHVYNTLLEEHLVNERGWKEFSVYPLFSPQSLIAEGSANYGIHVAFPGDERVIYEKTKLFPIAGIDPSRADRYYRVQGLVDQLSYAGNEAARRYLNGEIDASQAAQWLTRYALSDPKRAEQRVRFFDTYRSYVINYNLGKDLVRKYIESRGGTTANPDKRWDEFEKLLSSPRLPSGLKVH